MELTAAQSANLALRVLLELAVLAALAFWGFQLHGPAGMRVLAGLGAPVAAAVVWGAFASPRAAVTLPPGATLAVQVAVLTAAVAALVHTGKPVVAAVLAVLAVLNGALIAWWGQ